MSRANDRLAHSLRIIGLASLAERAAKGEFSDFESPHALPKMVLVTELRNTMEPAALKLAEIVIRGYYDNTKEDAAVWLQSEEGRALLAVLAAGSGE